MYISTSVLAQWLLFTICKRTHISSQWTFTKCRSTVTPQLWFEYGFLLSVYATFIFFLLYIVVRFVDTFPPLTLTLVLVLRSSSLGIARDIHCQVKAWIFLSIFSIFSLTQTMHLFRNPSSLPMRIQGGLFCTSSLSSNTARQQNFDELCEPLCFHVVCPTGKTTPVVSSNHMLPTMPTQKDVQSNGLFRQCTKDFVEYLAIFSRREESSVVQSQLI